MARPWKQKKNCHVSDMSREYRTHNIFNRCQNCSPQTRAEKGPRRRNVFVVVEFAISNTVTNFGSRELVNSLFHYHFTEQQ